ncbi:MAG: N-acetyltransferase [Oscillospiraceae bacterium]|nr:N-acetyltransferase [Oscillospiraceae bacterium]
MQMLTVRPAALSDLARLLEIYETARAFMRKTGNPTQWADGSPHEHVLLADIQKGQLYAVCSGDAVVGGFALIEGDDPTYARIENGAWPNSLPYATLHRVGSDGSCRGVFAAAVAFAERRHSELRVDTHADNKVMQRAIAKQGFCYCGIIYVADGTPRLAYHKSVR